MKDSHSSVAKYITRLKKYLDTDTGARMKHGGGGEGDKDAEYCNNFKPTVEKKQMEHIKRYRSLLDDDQNASATTYENVYNKLKIPNPDTDCKKLIDKSKRIWKTKTEKIDKTIKDRRNRLKLDTKEYSTYSTDKLNEMFGSRYHHDKKPSHERYTFKNNENSQKRYKLTTAKKEQEHDTRKLIHALGEKVSHREKKADSSASKKQKGNDNDNREQCSREKDVNRILRSQLDLIKKAQASGQLNASSKKKITSSNRERDRVVTRSETKSTQRSLRSKNKK